MFAISILTLDGPVAGSCSVGTVEQSQGRVAVDCGETDQREVREEIIVGNAYGRKLGSHGSKAILLSHTRGWRHHHSLAPPQHASIGS